MDEKIDVFNSVHYVQLDDSNESTAKGCQELIIKEEDAGGGKFFVISTERWSFDRMEDLISMLQKFSRKAAID